MIAPEHPCGVEAGSEGSSGGDVAETEMQPIHDGGMLSASLEAVNLERSLPPHKSSESAATDESQQRLEIVVQNPVVSAVAMTGTFECKSSSCGRGFSLPIQSRGHVV